MHNGNEIFDYGYMNSMESPREKRPNKITFKHGSVFFDKDVLQSMIDNNFEFQHSAQDSIFKNKEILMRRIQPDKDIKDKDYVKQIEMMESIMYALRGQTTREKI